MTKAEQTEADRIANELASAHGALIGCGQAGLNPNKLETLTLAKAVQIFRGTLEAETLSAFERAQRDHEAKL